MEPTQSHFYSAGHAHTRPRSSYPLPPSPPICLSPPSLPAFRPQYVPYPTHPRPDVPLVHPPAVPHPAPLRASNTVASYPSLPSTHLTTTNNGSQAPPLTCPLARQLPPKDPLSYPDCPQPPAPVPISAPPLYDIQKLLAGGCTIVSGDIYNSNGYRMCGVMNQHDKPCRRIGKCPFHTCRIPLSASNSINGTVDSFGTVTVPTTSASLHPSTISQLRSTDGLRELTRTPAIPRKRQFKTGWTREEHFLFLKAFDIYGRGCWKETAKVVGSKSSTQVQSHAQKFIKRSKQLQKKKRSIHDMNLLSKEMKQVAERLETDPSLFAVSAMARLRAARVERQRSQDLHIAPGQHVPTPTVIPAHRCQQDSLSQPLPAPASTSDGRAIHDIHTQNVAARPPCVRYEVPVPPPVSVRDATVGAAAQSTAPHQYQQPVLLPSLPVASIHASSPLVRAPAESTSPGSGKTPVRTAPAWTKRMRVDVGRYEAMPSNPISANATNHCHDGYANGQEPARESYAQGAHGGAAPTERIGGTDMYSARGDEALGMQAVCDRERQQHVVRTRLFGSQYAIANERFRAGFSPALGGNFRPRWDQ